MSVNVFEKTMKNNEIKVGTGIVCVNRNVLFMHIIPYNSSCFTAEFSRVFDTSDRHT